MARQSLTHWIMGHLVGTLEVASGAGPGPSSHGTDSKVALLNTTRLPATCQQAAGTEEA